MNPFPMSQRLVEAALNGGAQGIVLTVGVAVILRCLPRINAATRHAVWFASLLLVAALPVLHFVVTPGSEFPAPGDLAIPEVDGAVETGTEGLDPSPAIEFQNSPPLTPLAGSGFQRENPVLLATTDLNPRSPASVSDHPVEPEGILVSNPEHRIVPSIRPDPSVEALSWGAQLAGARRRLVQGWSLELPLWVSMTLVLAWLGVATCRLGGLAVECVRLRKLKYGAIRADDRAAALLLQIGREMGVTRSVDLRIGPVELVPLVAGFRHPAVLLPAGFLEANTREQVIQVLRHELAHVHRRDDWSNLLQQTLHAALFFHPSVWWISEQLSLDREIACDDHVLEGTPRARSYALLLTDFAGRHLGRDLVAAPAVWNRKTQLKERIAMILDTKRNSSPRMAGTLAGLLVVVIAGFTGIVLQAAPRVALGADSAGDADAVTTDVVDVSVDTSTDVAVEVPDPVIARIESPDAVLLAVASTDDSTQPRPKPPVPPVPPASADLPGPPSAVPLPRTVTIHRSPDEARAGHPIKVDPDDSRGDKGGHSSLEQRLDRLERLMEKWMAQGRGNVFIQPGSPDMKFNFDPKSMAKLSEQSRKLALDASRQDWNVVGPSKDLQSIVREEAKREAEKSDREVERTMAKVRRDQERAVKESVESMNRENLDGLQQLEIQRKTLESARQALEKQLETVDQRLERLDEEQDRLKVRLKKEAKEMKESKGKHKDPLEGESSAGTSPGATPAQ